MEIFTLILAIISLIFNILALFSLSKPKMLYRYLLISLICAVPVFFYVILFDSMSNALIWGLNVVGVGFLCYLTKKK